MFCLFYRFLYMDRLIPKFSQFVDHSLNIHCSDFVSLMLAISINRNYLFFSCKKPDPI
jgi:hypothetical protein